VDTKGKGRATAKASQKAKGKNQKLNGVPLPAIHA
jgi:hypothetical protein